MAGVACRRVIAMILLFCVLPVHDAGAMQTSCTSVSKTAPKATLTLDQLRGALKKARPTHKISKSQEKELLQYIQSVMPYGDLNTISWSGSTLTPREKRMRESMKKELQMFESPKIAVDDDMLYLQVPGFFFDEKSMEEVLRMVFEDEVLYGVVLDLRGNNGGRFDTLFDFMGLFVDGGVEMNLDYRRQKTCVLRSTSLPLISEELSHEYPFYVIVDGKTSSAGEIAADLARHYKNAKLIGQKTRGREDVDAFGKFTVGSMAGHYTVTVGTMRSSKGFPLKPDIEVDPTDEEAIFEAIRRDLSKVRPIGR